MEQQFQRIKVFEISASSFWSFLSYVSIKCLCLCHNVQLCYEQQISALEKQQQQPRMRNVTAEAALAATHSAEEKLQQEKKAHLEKEVSLQKQIESLRLQLKQKVCVVCLCVYMIRKRKIKKQG